MDSGDLCLGCLGLHGGLADVCEADWVSVGKSLRGPMCRLLVPRVPELDLSLGQSPLESGALYDYPSVWAGHVSCKAKIRIQLCDLLDLQPGTVLASSEECLQILARC